MQTFQYGFTCLLLVFFSKTAHSDIGTPCPNNNECVTGERCNATLGCECDTDISYQDGPVQTTKCFLAKDLGVACTTVAEKDECMLGNGGTGAICSATQECVCDTDYVEDASTCKRDCGDPTLTTGYTVTAGAGVADKLQGATASVACATGYSGTPADIVCQAGGSWVTPTGCTIDDCGTPPSTSGYDVTVGGGGAETSYGDTASVACATGYTGTTAPISCQAGGTWETPTGCNIDAKNLGQNCDIADQCVAGNGGPSTVCDTTCKKDCGSPTNATGYTLTTGGGASATYEGAEATVTCATGYAGTPSPATVACQADGTWAASSGCAIDAKNLGENCYIDDQCVAGDGGSVAVCDTTCKIAKNLNQTCDIDDQCVAGDGGPGTVCDTTCKKDCGTPTNPTGYTLTASAGTQQGDTATVACAPGYTGTPSPASVTCPAGGSWPTSTGCNIVDCGSLTAPTNGTIALSSGTTYISVATYSCDKGYAVTGSATRTCGADGSWSGSNPTCEMNGAGGIRQKFSLVVLIGVLVLALM